IREAAQTYDPVTSVQELRAESEAGGYWIRALAPLGRDDNRGYSAVHPPSTTSAEPVIRREASLARNTIAPVTSSLRPIRHSLIFGSTSLRNGSFSKNGRVSGVSMKVGPRVFTRISCGASSIAIALVKPSMACLEAQ